MKDAREAPSMVPAHALWSPDRGGVLGGAWLPGACWGGTSQGPHPTIAPSELIQIRYTPSLAIHYRTLCFNGSALGVTLPPLHHEGH